ncbi:MAG: hypothetical protein PVF58_21900 [Candidatus Methanofastidiosia archaeon]|jgi:AAA15 family ATPase/GTPase
MIHTLRIDHFKSINQLKMDCNTINILIGKPNTGKSNILESMGMFSFHYKSLTDFVRFEKLSNLFYDEDMNNPITVQADEQALDIKFEKLKFFGVCRAKKEMVFEFNFDYDGSGSLKCFKELSEFKFYKFKVLNNFPLKRADILLPPYGENLFTILMTKKEIKSAVSSIFTPFGLRLVFKPQQNKIEVLKQYEDIFITLPYSLVSETLQKVVFYVTAIMSNSDSVLIFQELESHGFPYYLEFLAEKISADEQNQYFITTHNPKFLFSVLEKAPDKVNVFYTYFEDYQTKVKLLTDTQLHTIRESPRGLDALE